jgi:hypothetical protein
MGWKLKEQERELSSARKTRRIGGSGARSAQQLATMSLSTLMARSAGSGLVLISGGYLPESVAPIRRCVEANLRIGAVLKDPSRQHALAESR